jgi:hypothetical protein
MEATGLGNDPQLSLPQADIILPLLHTHHGLILIKQQKAKDFATPYCMMQKSFIHYCLSLPQDHEASTKHLKQILFWAKAPIYFQLFPTFPISSFTALFHVLLDLPLLRRP